MRNPATDPRIPERHTRRVARLALSLLCPLWLAPLAPAAGSAEAGLELSPAEGVVFEDAERELRVDLDGRFALDWVQYDSRNQRDSGLRLDRALIGVDASWREVFEARVVADLAGIDTRDGLWEAWASARHGRAVRLSAGLMPLPLGVEHSFREGSRSLVGYPGFPAFLTGRTDVAARLDGELWEGILSYDVSAALGEGFDLLGQRRGDPQLAGRVTTYPFRWVDASLEVGPYEFPLLSGVFASVAYAWTPDYDGELDVSTRLRNDLFDTGRLDGEGSRFLHWGAGIDFGPIRVVHEVVTGSLLDVRAPGGARVDFEDQITSWQLLAAWRITGEPYDSRPFRQRDMRRHPEPRHPLDGEGDERGWGMWELAVAYANADIDRDFQDLGFIPVNPNAPPAEDEPFSSSQEFRTFSAALNWYPTSYLRVSGEVVRTIADQSPSAFESHGRDTSWLLRVQYTF